MPIPRSYVNSEPPQDVEARDDIILSYIKNQVSFLKIQYPNKSEKELEDIVKRIVKEKIQRPKIKVVYYPEPGNSKLKTEDLLDFTRKFNNKFIAPSGTFFELPTKKIGKSNLFIMKLNNDRKVAKKLMFKLKEEGKLQEAENTDSVQNIAKVLTNALTGNHNYEGSPFYDLESYNGITSTCRNGTVLCYSTLEILLKGNYSFRDGEQVLEYIMNCSNYEPNIEKTRKVLEKFPWLHIPSTDEMVSELTKTMIYYCKKKEIVVARESAANLINKLSPEQKVYTFYRRNFFNLLKYNDGPFREFMSETLVLDKYVSEEEIEELPDDLAIMLATMFDTTLEDKTFSSKLINERPDIARKYVSLSKIFMNHVKKINDIFDTFLYSGELLSNIPNRQTMIRQIVPNSDTDSMLYTVYNQVSWWTNGDLRVNKNSIGMAAFTMWIIGNVLDATNYDMSISRGCIGDKTKLLYTKYEFMYPVYCKTNLGKHYFGLQTYREGHKQVPPVLDVKGVSFQTSNIPEVSRKFSKDFLKTILNSFAENGSTDIEELITQCLEYEKTMIDSLMSGELTYCGNISVKNEDEYKDFIKSIYFNYTMWEEVFSEKYGNIRLPGKFPLLPIKEKAFKTKGYLDYIEAYDRESHKKLMKFLSNMSEKYPGKKISRIPLPITISKIPKIFLPVIDLRKIIYKNIAPSQLALEQLGVYLGNSKKMPLFHDFYSNVMVDRIDLK